MTALNVYWDFVDAWVLAAIGIYERPCSLAELIAAAEAINHEVVQEVELVTALGKLTGSGLVRVFEGWTFELTDDGTSLWSGGAGDLQAQLRLVEAQLSDIEPGTVVVNLSPGAFEQALEEYRGGGSQT